MSTPPPPFGQPPGGLPPGFTPGAPPAPGPASSPPGWIPVDPGAPPAPPVVPVSSGGRRRNPLLTALGIALIVGGVVGAILLALGGTKRYGDGVKDLARAPANCVTTLEVTEDDTYYFYVESQGEVADVRGDCPASGESFEASDADTPTLTLADSDGEGVRLRRDDGVSYDTDGYSGELLRTADLDAGRYQLTVDAEDDVAVAVGAVDVESLKPNVVLPIVVGLLGVLLGVVLIVLGRGKKAPPVPPASPFGPGGPGPDWTPAQPR